MLHHGLKRRVLAAGMFLYLLCPSALGGQAFRSAWPEDAERVWIGPEYWANRLQDWRLSEGRLECVTSGADRNVYLLTCQSGKQQGELTLKVRLGSLDKDGDRGKGWVGFRLGSKAEIGDYRRAAIYGEGIDAGVTMDGQLFLGEPVDWEGGASIQSVSLHDLELQLTATPGSGGYRLTLTALDPRSRQQIGAITKEGIASEATVGSLALVSHRQGQKGEVRFWFADLVAKGSKVEVNEGQAFGPILFAQHTLSRRVLKMTAQLPPIGESEDPYVRLQVKKGFLPIWKTIGKSRIDALARTATFRIENWDDTQATPYRLAYAMTEPDGKRRDHYWEGTIRPNPVEKETVVVAAFTGNNDFGFPNEDMVGHLKIHDPDLMVFTGDQIYERVGAYGTQRSPLDKAVLDYLRKWYILGWSFGELLKDRPSVCLPDDHDVYHGNIWGAGGRASSGSGDEGQDKGGYTMPAEWVKMVERTQTSHMTDPYDPTPVLQGIGVYYGDMNYGGISFAIIEDRKFKSSPKEMLPEANVVNGWATNPDFDAVRDGNIPGAILLGDRQLAFLRHWAGDWRNAVMKAVISQTVLANVATLPAPAYGDEAVPRLPIPKPGEYPEGEEQVADMDSNGWPQTGRNKALREMRRAFAFHIAGDQHLAYTIQYGVDNWRDAGYCFSVPAVANVWPRRWFPTTPGQNRKPNTPRNTGDFLDGFGNHVTVYAVANPMITGREPSVLYDRSTGYGIVRFNKPDRTITMECWPRYADPSNPDEKQYPGWPKTISQLDNYGRRAVAYLPTVKLSGMTDPVLQVIDEASGEIVYTLRIKGASFRPRVFRDGVYTLKVGEPGTDKMKTLQGVQSLAPEKSRTIRVKF